MEKLNLQLISPAADEWAGCAWIPLRPSPVVIRFLFVPIQMVALVVVNA